MEELNATSPSNPPAYVNEKSYIISEQQLWNLVSFLVRNISNDKPAISFGSTITTVANEYNITTINANFSRAPVDLTEDEEITMIFYILIFFVWYGGIIFVCLIGFGVYKTSSSYDIYKAFVEREELRAQIKQEKLDKLEKKRLQRQSSEASSMCITLSVGSDLSTSWNGGVYRSSFERNSRLPSPRSPNSIVQEEEETLLANNSNVEKPANKSHKLVVFDL